MKIYKIFYLDGTFGEINVSDANWARLHTKNQVYVLRQYATFLRNYKIDATVFNLNSLDIFRGIVLTEGEFKNLKERLQ
jgi:hypothetical protein